MLKLIAIVGPTGVGKTKLSIALAKHYDAEIINCDAMQVYKGMDIGTAKVTTEEMDGIPHHLLSFVPVTRNYTVFDYQKDGRQVIDEIRSRGKNIILVGGTGLYLKALLYRYEFHEVPKIEHIEDLTLEEMLATLQREGVSLENVDVSNRRRVERLYTNVMAGVFPTKTGNELLYDAVFIGLITEREHLYSIIDTRVSKMISDGLVDEVKSLLPYANDSKALSTAIGYKEIISYLEGDCTLEEAISLIQKNSRHYAKRQYTFFRHQLPVHWTSVCFDDFQKTIQEAIDWITKENSSR